ncbi:unnamed protein product [Cylicocyclus nassatus]|uniref:Hexosyltransferase n=1 Tax=Cylicocyclus nassatus TaxID=53992 RepID=A0AA36GXE7_CYLNA|nr:unnamed protein product [Cylicocyclus nassatus]
MKVLYRHKFWRYRKQILFALIAAVFAWWPPYNVDVASETSRAVAGKTFRVVAENNPRLHRRLAEPLCRATNETLKLLVIVKSSFHNEQQRSAIRKTWGSKKGSVRVVFIVGVVPSASSALNRALAREIEAQSDILQVDVIDTYRNNTLKFFHSINYAFKSAGGCSASDFVLLVDDDYMVHVDMLLRYISSKNPSQQLYEGWRFDTAPFRFRLHKHAVSLDNYPFNRYPPYISAGAVLLSRKTISYFYYAMQLVRLYSFDDIYAGIIAYLLKITPKHNEAFVFWSRSISPEEWRSGKVLAAHGYPYDRLLDGYPLLDERA